MMSVREAARAVQGDWSGEDTDFYGVSTDSRIVGRGDLFIALVGDKFDGHDFIAEVKEKGAVAAVVCHGFHAKASELQIPLIQVENTRLGLGQLAAYWRGRFNIPLIAVTGSNGKTTVKEMIASILRHAAVIAPHTDDAEIGIGDGRQFQ